MRKWQEETKIIFCYMRKRKAKTKIKKKTTKHNDK